VWSRDRARRRPRGGRINAFGGIGHKVNCDMVDGGLGNGRTERSLTVLGIINNMICVEQSGLDMVDRLIDARLV
jgi:hypothetical protein